MTSSLVYMDHAATTPVMPEVVEVMAPFAAEQFGNPSGSHRVARRARAALEDARDQVAELLGAHPGEVVFTSGGTESDNMAVLGTLAAAPWGQAAVVCSAVEHAAVLAPAEWAAKGPWQAVVRLAPVDADGTVDPGRLEELLDPSVALVSVMAANNEVGTIQPLAEVVAAARRLAPRASVHTDAVQAVPWLEVAELAAGVDLVSMTAHKLGGPKGVGVLVVREGTALQPIVHGGGQERERRSGTQNVAGAVGLATALGLTTTGRRAEGERVGALRDRLAEGLAAIAGTVESARRERVLPGHCHVRFTGVDQEELLLLLDEEGVCASAGSACASGALEPSHVLAAMGVPADDARSAIRFSLGRTTSQHDVDRTLAVVAATVERLRS